MIIALFLSCVTKTQINVGVIDIIDAAACVIQMKNEEFIDVPAKFCVGLKEGDVIKIERIN